MKNIIILLILVLFPIVGFSSIDEYKTDVYFANGIDRMKEMRLQILYYWKRILKKKSIRIVLLR